jgi:hypothetical protein
MTWSYRPETQADMTLAEFASFRDFFAELISSHGGRIIRHHFANYRRVEDGTTFIPTTTHYLVEDPKIGDYTLWASLNCESEHTPIFSQRIFPVIFSFASVSFDTQRDAEAELSDLLTKVYSHRGLETPSGGNR